MSGSYIAAAPTSQSHDCLVEIAFLAADSGERDHRSTLTAIDFASWRAELFRYPLRDPENPCAGSFSCIGTVCCGTHG
jgi:hypothetical protein